MAVTVEPLQQFQFLFGADFACFHRRKIAAPRAHPNRAAIGFDAQSFSDFEPPRLSAAQVIFNEWTNYGLLRHATFDGWRDDKAPREIARERSSVARG
jgi:ATP-dependent DNA ligase